MNSIKKIYLSALTLISPTLNTKVYYKKRFGKKINLDNPQTLNEKIQWLKLNKYCKDPIYTMCADKYLVRDYVIKCGCKDILIPLIGVYDNASQIDWNSLPQRFVLKWNFGCGLNILCDDKSKFDEKHTKKLLNKWKHNKFYLQSSEMQYKNIKRKIICEELLDDHSGHRIKDYKFYCFNGKPYCVMICEGREYGKPQFYFFTEEWKFLNILKTSLGFADKVDIKKPKDMDKMFKYAAKLCKEFPFVRVDLYDIDGHIYFGELTFTPSAGLDGDYTDEGCLFLGNQLNINKYR